MDTLLEQTTCWPGFGPDEFASLASDPRRQVAYDAYAALPLPTDRTEEYRRTPPRLLKLGQFPRLPDLAWDGTVTPHPWDEHFDIVIEIDGTQVALAGSVPGVEVTPLDKADPDLLESYARGPASPQTPRKLRELNHAFWNVGLCIHVAAGVSVEKGILIRTRLPERNAGALLPRLLVVAEANSRLDIAEVYTSSGGPGQCIGNREIYAEPGAHVKLASLQDWGPSTLHLGEDWALARRDATVNICTLTLGGRLSKLATGCDVCEPGANAYLGGLYFARGRQHFDQMTLQRHSAPNTYSNMLYKGAAKQKGYSVYQGIIRATEGAIGVDAYQTNNNLILDDTSRADSLPGLLINADELACSHGATMGNLDEEQVYYLRSRGIDELTARKMLVLGFFDEIVEERITYQPIRDHLHEVIERKLST